MGKGGKGGKDAQQHRNQSALRGARKKKPGGGKKGGAKNAAGGGKKGGKGRGGRAPGRKPKKKDTTPKHFKHAGSDGGAAQKTGGSTGVELNRDAVHPDHFLPDGSVNIKKLERSMTGDPVMRQLFGVPDRLRDQVTPRESIDLGYVKRRMINLQRDSIPLPQKLIQQQVASIAYAATVNALANYRVPTTVTQQTCDGIKSLMDQCFANGNPSACTSRIDEYSQCMSQMVVQKDHPDIIWPYNHSNQFMRQGGNLEEEEWDDFDTLSLEDVQTEEELRQWLIDNGYGHLLEQIKNFDDLEAILNSPTQNAPEADGTLQQQQPVDVQEDERSKVEQQARSFADRMAAWDGYDV